jgi:UDP-N-acetylmuramate--alanine ligase
VWRQNDGQPTRLVTISLQVPGEHNVRNATAVVSAAHQLHLDLQSVARALAAFSGTGRRFDIRGEAEGIIVIDDYAHHPTEIRATLAAARRRFPGRRLWAVWQPHTYSRTAALKDDFAAAFKDADRVIVTEIFGSREKPSDFSAYKVVRLMKHPAVHFTPGLEQATAHLLAALRSGDVLLVLSAGDADQISGWVLAALQAKETNHD